MRNQKTLDAATWDLLRMTSKKAQPLSRVADKLGLSPSDLQTCADAANAAGFSVRIFDGYVSSKAPAVAPEATRIRIGDTKPGRKRVALVTDLHAGSSHFHRAGLAAFLALSWARGCRVAICTGDILDGNKDVLRHDQNLTGWDGQSALAVDAVREAPPFEWVAIDGNHDGYYSAAGGLVSGRLLEQAMRAAGVPWTFAGVCLGRARVHGADWLLWHPHGGASTPNAIRRILNDKIENLQEKTDVLAIGHFHKFATVSAFPEGVFGVAGGTFQEKRSEFANRISRPWDVGGCIVSWTLDKEGKTSEYAAEFFPSPPGDA